MRVSGDINRFDVLDPLDKRALDSLNMVSLRELEAIERYDYRMANNGIKQMLAKDDQFD